MLIKGYRWDVTGGYGTDFYSAGGKYVCGTSGSLLSPGQYSEGIHGGGFDWVSHYEGENPFVLPGQKRYVNERANGAPVAAIIYRDAGIYDIKRKDTCIRAQHVENQYVYLREDEPIAICRRIDGSKERVKASLYEWATLRFAAALPDDLSDDWKLLILTFPMLKFGP